MDLVEQNFQRQINDDGLTLSNLERDFLTVYNSMDNLEYDFQEDLVVYSYMDAVDDSQDLGISALNAEYFGLRLSDLGIDADADYGSSREGGASEEIINRLKRESAEEGKSIEKNFESVDCIICLEELSSGAEKLIRMPCSHVFHESCIVNWLLTKNSCPMCRQIPYDEDQSP